MRASYQAALRRFATMRRVVHKTYRLIKEPYIVAEKKSLAPTATLNAMHRAGVILRRDRPTDQ